MTKRVRRERMPHPGLGTQAAREIWAEYEAALHNGAPLPLRWLTDSLAAGRPQPHDKYRA